MNLGTSEIFLILALVGIVALVFIVYKPIFYLLQRKERQQVMEKLNAEQTLEYLAVDSNRNKDSKISIPPAWVLRLGLVGVLVASVLIYVYHQAQNGKSVADGLAIGLLVAAGAVGFVVSFFIEYWLANRHKSEFSNAAPINKYAIMRWALALVGVGFGMVDNAHRNFLAVLGAMAMWGAIGLAIGLWIEHRLSRGKSDFNVNISSLLIRIAFMAIGFGVALMGGFLWKNTLPDNFRGEEAVISGAMFILSALGFFVGYLVDRKINGKKE